MEDVEFDVEFDMFCLLLEADFAQHFVNALFDEEGFFPDI